MKRKNTIVAFGEIMTRLSAPRRQRLRQCLPGSLDASFAGAESNIAAAIALLGGRSRFVTALPQNALGDACAAFLRSLGVDTSGILRARTGRMPQYFIETGSGLRPGRVLYDRGDSCFSLARGADYAWETILEDASWLVISGISPALSRTAAEAVLHAAGEARARGVTVCCDLNYRASLWNWELGTPPRELARRVMAGLMPLVDVVITNPDQAGDVLGIPWTGPAPGCASEELYAKAARAISRAWPHLRQIVFTLRESHSASHNSLGALLHEPASGRIVMAPLADGRYQPYEMHAIEDRLGAGDAFAGAFIHALHEPALSEPGQALAFGVAAGCLAHSIPGDINFVSRPEIEDLARGNRSGRVVR